MSSKVIIDDSGVQDNIRRFSRDIRKELPISISLAFDMIGQRSQASYWRIRGGAPIKNKLTARSTRLIRSLAPQGGSRPGGVGSSEQIRSIQEFSKRYVGRFGTKVPYAGIHEYGGTIKPKTKKYLRFRTFDGQWHTVRKVVMPARPFLAPAARDEEGRTKNLIADTFARTWRG
jgi:phage gpG-like protein